jgi:hypothetical protein
MMYLPAAYPEKVFLTLWGYGTSQPTIVSRKSIFSGAVFRENRSRGSDQNEQ